MLAPISYKGVVPEMTPDLIKLYQDGFYAMYPAPKVEVTVRAEPIVWTKDVDPYGNGWSQLLDQVAKIRLQDKVEKDVYYFAPFTPTKSFGQFCGGGCVAGLGLLGTPVGQLLAPPSASVMATPTASSRPFTRLATTTAASTPLWPCWAGLRSEVPARGRA